MKKYPRYVIVLLLALAFAGCSTLESRIKEKADVFAKLTPVEQQIIRSRYIAVGFTPDMVYMALDKPEKVIPGPGANQETWVYYNFYSADGSSLVGSQKVVTHTQTGAPATSGRGGSPQNNTFSVEPDLAAENIKEEAAIKVHVRFMDGRVSSIEIVRPH